MSSAQTPIYQVSNWGQQFVDFTLPSGDVCQLKATLDLPELIELGVFEKLDALGVIVQEEHVERVKRPQDFKAKKLNKAQKERQENDSWKDLLKDKNKFSNLAEVTDKVICAIVVQPKVHLAYKELEDIGIGRTTHWTKIPQEERKEGLIYSDTIPFTDKMEIFEFAMSGVKRIKRFPVRSEQDLGNMANEPEVSDEAL